ncbi:MAG: hypothetical protein GF344_20345, partial [Chitinivibrionales bacterium]|nr:hypothetical protein [Chitinivibrionales bacterium]MBD3358951.1 hypothetical protein [Chitinivibrionales bacterium]
MKRTAQWTLAVVFILLALVSLATVAGVTLFNTHVVQKAVLVRINGAIPGSLTWDRLHIAPFTGRIFVDGARINSRDGRRIAQIGKLRVDFALLSLPRANPVINRLVLDRPQVTLDIDSTGVLNLAAAFAPIHDSASSEKFGDTAAFSWSPAFRSIHVTNGEATYADRRVGLLIEAAGLNLEGAVKLRGPVARLELSLDSGSISSPGYTTAIKDMLTAAALKGSSLDTLCISLRTDSSRLALAGRADSLFGTPRCRFSLTTSMDMEELFRTLHLPPYL